MKFTYFVSYAMILENGSLSFDNGFYPLGHEIESPKDITDLEDKIASKFKYSSAPFHIKISNFILVSVAGENANR